MRPLLYGWFSSMFAIVICCHSYSVKPMPNRIGSVMVSVLTWSAVDCGFEPQSGQTKNYKIGICCFSANQAALTKEKEQRLVGSESE